METQLSEKLSDLAKQLTYAQDIKGVARLRIQCDLKEWELVIAEARKIHHARKVVPEQRAYRA